MAAGRFNRLSSACLKMVGARRPLSIPVSRHFLLIGAASRTENERTAGSGERKYRGERPILGLRGCKVDGPLAHSCRLSLVGLIVPLDEQRAT